MPLNRQLRRCVRGCTIVRFDARMVVLQVGADQHVLRVGEELKQTP
jgi:hypothetical protein